MTDHDLSFNESQASVRPVVKLCDLIIAEGLLNGASAIQLRMTPEGCAVRYEIRGNWRDQMKIPTAAGRPVINRLRVMAALDRTSVPRPHAGEMRCLVNGKEYRLRAVVSGTGGTEELMIHCPASDPA